jgi:hypothetical protein
VPALNRRGLPGQSAFFASVTVAPDGTLDAVFQALTDVPAGTAPGPGVVSYDSYLTRSTDNGATRSSPVTISKVSSDPDGSSTNGLAAQFLGDYITTVAESSHVYAVWTDSRNASPLCGRRRLPGRNRPEAQRDHPVPHHVRGTPTSSWGREPVEGSLNPPVTGRLRPSGRGVPLPIRRPRQLVRIIAQPSGASGAFLVRPVRDEVPAPGGRGRGQPRR